MEHEFRDDGPLEPQPAKDEEWKEEDFRPVYYSEDNRNATRLYNLGITHVHT